MANTKKTPKTPAPVKKQAPAVHSAIKGGIKYGSIPALILMFLHAFGGIDFTPEQTTALQAGILFAWSIIVKFAEETFNIDIDGNGEIGG